MRKIVTAIFMAFLMLLVPISTVAHTEKISKIENIDTFNDDPPPEVHITESELDLLELYIESNFQGLDKKEAYALLNNVIDENLKVNFIELSDSLKSYGYDPIPDSKLDSVSTKDELKQLIQDYWDFSNYLFEGLLNKIIDLIKNRLGWLYELYDQGRVLFVDGVDLAANFVDRLQNLNIAVLFVQIVNVLITIPLTYFSTSINKLFNRDFDGFITSVENFTTAFTDNFIQLVDNVAAIIDSLGQTFQPIVNYLYDISDFIEWIVNDQPWEDRIEVTGTVTIIGKPADDLEVECKGQRINVGSDGKFSFYIDPDAASDDSFPKNSYYGMHNCQITIYKNGEFSKQTPKLLSYVFSSGKINWNFNIFNAKGKTNEFPLIEIFGNLFEKFQIFLSNFFFIEALF